MPSMKSAITEDDDNSEDKITLSRNAEIWKTHFNVYNPTVFHHHPSTVVRVENNALSDIDMRSVELPLPHLDIDEPLQNSVEHLQAFFIAFLSRISCYTNICVGLLVEDSNTKADARCLQTHVIIPAIFNIELNETIQQATEKCVESIKRMLFSKDIFYTNSELKGISDAQQHNLVIGTETSIDYGNDYIRTILHKCNILLLFADKNAKMRIFYHEKTEQCTNTLVNNLKCFPTFLSAVHSYWPAGNIMNVQVLTEKEMSTLHPATDTNFPRENLFKHLVRVCKKDPLKTAVKTLKVKHTFEMIFSGIRQLDKSMKNKLPLHGEKSVIGIHMGNSVAYVLSVLTLMKSGTTFLPLPVDWPIERINFTLQDANVARIITTTSLYEKVLCQAFPRSKIVMNTCVLGEDFVMVDLNRFGNDEQETVEEKKKVQEPCHNVASDCCYVMYTSGSTGKPKGIQVTENSVINVAEAVIGVWDLGPADTMAQFASIGFDASLLEILSALLSGATLAIFDIDKRLGNEFLRSVKVMEITTIILPPSMLNIYSPAQTPSLQKVIAGGEMCRLNTAVKWTSERIIRFFNGYGPTEATICTACYEYSPGTYDEDINRELPIGNPIDGVVVYLFDTFMNAVLPGIIGEMYIGGRGVSHGYIGHASSRNTEVFVQNPLSKQPQLLFKTGDYACKDKNGSITYICRLDDQVKVRGQRVNLNEVETVLMQHPMVEMAVVVLHNCSLTGESCIAAFVSPANVCISDIRKYLSKFLPHFMMPTFIHLTDVSNLPQTPSGKVNRRLLEVNEIVHSSGSLRYHNPCLLNETEILVSKFWCCILKFDESLRLSLDKKSSFKELGGNSLNRVLLLRHIEDKLEIEISFSDIAALDTIEEFAEIIKRKQDTVGQTQHAKLRAQEDLRKLILEESQLDAGIVRQLSKNNCSYTTPESKVATPKHPQNILISGVTGFLGVFLLAELLEQSDSHIYCMVRETAEDRGSQRIVLHMNKYELWKPEYKSRITAISSDISKPTLGMKANVYESLCNEVNVVFMNAAKVNLNTSYEDHKAANVFGTKEMIMFATTGLPKFLFFTSSLSALLFPPCMHRADKRLLCSESDFFDDPSTIEGGYGQSKWSGERLVSQALQYLPGGTIFRPGRLSGRVSDGRCPKTQMFASMLIGMKRLGYFPDLDFPFDLTPVDFCAKAMAEIALSVLNNTGKNKSVYHLYNKDTVPFRDLFKDMGLQPLPLEIWRTKLRSVESENRELILLTPFYNSPFFDLTPRWPVFMTTNTDCLISEKTKGLLKPKEELMKMYKSFLCL